MSATDLPAKPRAILFDWDNTLVDTWPVIHDAMNHTFDAFDMPHWTMTDIKTRVRKSMRDSFPGLFGADWERAGKVFFGRFREIHKERLAVLDGAEDLLKALTEDGIHLSVVSNKTGGYLREEINHLGWDRFFVKAVGATDAERDKPDPIVIDQALQGSGIRAGEGVWMVGDSDIDLECGHNAGCVAILIRKEPPKVDEFGKFPPNHHFENCYSFCNFVKNL